MFNFFTSIFTEIIKTAGIILASFLVLAGVSYKKTQVSLPQVQEETQVIFEENISNEEEIVETEEKLAVEKKEAPKTESIIGELEKPIEKKETVNTVKASVIEEKILNEKTRASLVNILCTTKRGGSFEPLSGSGVIIDPRGVIVTNAHVAEFFLLEDYQTEDNIDCVIRMGSPARPLYKASLLNISEKWVRETASSINNNERTGTGENDYALLLISENVGGEPIRENTVFPYLSINTDFSAQKNHPIFLAGYPAEFLGGIIIQKDLWPVSSSVEVQTSYYFDEEGKEKADVLGLGGSVIAQSGASGGAVVDSYTGELVGVVVTTSEAKTTKDRNLNAITLNHISRAMAKATGRGLKDFLRLDLKKELQKFQANQFETLKSVLVKELEK